ncbi:MAG: ferrochelatase [bacterium]
MKSKNKGVLLMSYGSIYKIEDVERFYTHILKGRKPSEELLDDLRKRFEAIGGSSPLNHISFKQAEKLQQIIPYKVYLAFKHIDPYIEEVVEKMENDLIDEAVALILSPYYSNYNISDYFKRASSPKIKFHYVYGYYDHPLLVDIFCKRIEDVRKSIGNDGIFYIFSAHSLPVQASDIYPEQLNFVVKRIVEKLSIENYVFCYQSQGKSGGNWLGPDILEVIEQIPNDFKIILSCPIGFISEHLEVLYDIDIEAKNFAENKGKRLYRISLPNYDDDFINLLSDIVRKHL